MNSLKRKRNRSRLEQLKALRDILADEIDSRPGARDLASLAKQYRETITEIEQLEGADDTDDELSEILLTREADGKSGAVRKNRTQLPS